MLLDLYTKEFIEFARSRTGGAEDAYTIHSMFEHLLNRTTYLQVIKISKAWTTYDNLHQTNLAITHAGIYHASRFIMLMDFLVKKEAEKNV